MHVIPRVAVGSGCRVGAGVRIKDSILLANVAVGAHTIIMNTIVDKHSSIGTFTTIYLRQRFLCAMSKLLLPSEVKQWMYLVTPGLQR